MKRDLDKFYGASFVATARLKDAWIGELKDERLIYVYCVWSYLSEQVCCEVVICYHEKTIVWRSDCFQVKEGPREHAKVKAVEVKDDEDISQLSGHIIQDALAFHNKWKYELVYFFCVYWRNLSVKY